MRLSYLVSTLGLAHLSYAASCTAKNDNTPNRDLNYSPIDRYGKGTQTRAWCAGRFTNGQTAIGLIKPGTQNDDGLYASLDEWDCVDISRLLSLLIIFDC